MKTNIRPTVSKVVENAEKQRKTGQSLSAIDNLESKLLEILSPKEKAEILFTLGTLYNDIGNTKKSKKYYLKALRFAELITDRMLQAYILSKISSLYLKTNGIDKASKINEKAYNLVKYKKVKEALRIKSTINEIFGNIYFTDKKYSEALKYYKKALELAQKSNFIEREITIMTDIANIWISKNKPEKAESILVEYLAKAKLKYIIAVPSILIRLSKLNFNCNNYQKAKIYCEEAIKTAKEYSLKRDEIEAYEGMGYIYEKLNDSTKSKEMFKLAITNTIE